MAENTIMVLLREDPEFLVGAIKEIAAYTGDVRQSSSGVHHSSAKAHSILRDMASSLIRHATLTDRQSTYARDLIERHFLGLLADLAKEVEVVRQEVVAEAKESEVHYAANARWGSF